MICNQCGTVTQANVGFCPNCGATNTASELNCMPRPEEGLAGSASPVNAPMADQTLVPIYNRRSVLRSSLPWIAVLVVCVTVATAVQLSRHFDSQSVWKVPDAGTAPIAPTAAAAPATATVAPAGLARLLKITDLAEFVRQPEVADGLKRALGSNLEEFDNNLGVSDSPILAGNVITFTGCAPHACSVAEAVVSMSTDTGMLTAAILANNHIRIYGASSNKLEDCPDALQAWAKKLAGGSAGNFTYQMMPPGEPGAGIPDPPLAPPDPQQDAAQPTFDCGKAKTPTELQICADPYLAASERSMVSAYNSALQRLATGQKESFLREHTKWFKDYAWTCNGISDLNARRDCITRYLKSRTQQLERR